MKATDLVLRSHATNLEQLTAELEKHLPTIVIVDCYSILDKSVEDKDYQLISEKFNCVVIVLQTYEPAEPDK